MSNGSAGVVWSSFVTGCVSLPPAGEVKPVLMSADFTLSGVHAGFTARTRAAAPAACGLDIEVPWIMLYSGEPAGPLCVLKAAQIATPGAVTSGLMTLGLVRSGPRELKPAMRSAKLALSSSEMPTIVAVWPAPCPSHVRSDAPSHSPMCTVGITCVSETTLFL